MKTEEHVEEHVEAKSATVRRAEHMTNQWLHIQEEGWDWRAALKRCYWQQAAEKFKPGDRVEIQSHDHFVVFEMRILDVNMASDPFYLRAVFLPIVPRDLELPEMAAQRPPRYA